MKYIEDEVVYSEPHQKAEALRVSDLAKRLSHSYPTLLTAMLIAHDPRSFHLLPQPTPDNPYPSVLINRKDSDETHGFMPSFFLQEIVTSTVIIDDFKRSYLADALIVLGDALYDNDYFGHDPSLEMVYHLRNGLAHGNKFNITPSGQRRLSNYPAHTRDSWRRGGDKVDFEITMALQDKPILFEYMMDGDILDIIGEVGTCLQKKATGLPIMPPELRNV